MSETFRRMELQKRIITKDQNGAIDDIGYWTIVSTAALDSIQSYKILGEYANAKVQIDAENRRSGMLAETELRLVVVSVAIEEDLSDIVSSVIQNVHDRADFRAKVDEHRATHEGE